MIDSNLLGPIENLKLPNIRFQLVRVWILDWLRLILVADTYAEPNGGQIENNYIVYGLTSGKNKFQISSPSYNISCTRQFNVFMLVMQQQLEKHPKPLWLINHTFVWASNNFHLACNETAHKLNF